MKDIVYYYTKTDFEQKELGEIQKGFNLSFVLDGTKDSARINVINFESKEIEPYTIIQHKATNTWWIISNDKVERYTNESGFMYIHNLQLLGAIELLNARDLTDSGFNQNRYNIGTFIHRMLQLSTFEFKDNYDIDYGGYTKENLNDTTIVDYIKTYENYTPLSALRELLDGYNCAIKLTFNTTVLNNKTRITSATFKIVSKTGDLTLSPLEESEFDIVKETKTMNKNSFGTTVISNSENVVSTKAKTYPSIGTCRVSSNENNITNENAIIRLPSNINRVNWLKICFNNVANISFDIDGTTFSFSPNYMYQSDSYNDQQWESMYQDIEDYFLLAFNDEAKRKIIAYLESVKSKVFEILNKASVVTLYNCERWNAYNNNWVKPDTPQDFYFPIWHRYNVQSTMNHIAPLVLAPKTLRDSLPTLFKFYSTIGWDRDKDYIELNAIFAKRDDVYDFANMSSYAYTDLRDNTYDNGYAFLQETITWTYGFNQKSTVVSISLKQLSTMNRKIDTPISFVVNYVPMTDLKIKYDNNSDSKDTQLYNQNGRLNDGVALSKLLVSYTKEIESDNITKFADYYNYNYVPQVGQLVNISGEQYVINNVSLDFYQNENSDNVDNVGYYISGEFTMSKNVATKSLLTNPNRNIRDYGIPQNNNVKRKQLYRDFYQLGHSIYLDSDNDYFLGLDKVLNLSCLPQTYQDHIAIIKLGFNSAYGGDSDNGVDPSDTWYYQLNSTVYCLKKALYEAIDFKDNNIIGYSPLNVSSGFDITKLLSGLTNMINTPISYVDDNGEFKDIELAFCTVDQVNQIYQDYTTIVNISPSATLYNSSPFIDSLIYEGSSSGYSTYYYNNEVYNGGYQYSTVIDLTEWIHNELGISQPTSDITPNVDIYCNGEKLDQQYIRYINISGVVSEPVYEYLLSIGLETTAPSGTYSIVLNYIQVSGVRGAKDICDFKIIENDYNKDALEVPFFEYVCQIEDSSEVLIGDNILDNTNQDICYIYPVRFVASGYASVNNQSGRFGVDQLYVDPNAYTGVVDLNVFENNGFRFTDYPLKMEYVYENQRPVAIDIHLYKSVSISSDKVVTFTDLQDFSDFMVGRDIVIGRYTINDKTVRQVIGGTNLDIVDTKTDILAIIKNTDIDMLGDGGIRIYISHYKL